MKLFKAAHFPNYIPAGSGQYCKKKNNKVSVGYIKRFLVGSGMETDLEGGYINTVY